MACLSNTPSFTYVSVQNMVINYSNIYYSIRNMYSNDKYFYWDKNESPYELITSNKILDSKEGLYLILVNNKGTFILPNQTDIVINFDNNNGNESSTYLSNLISKVDDISKKYVHISETIDGIIKTVGSISTDVNQSSELYTKIRQTADEIELLAQKITQEYSKDNQQNELREEIISYTVSLNTLLNDFITKIRIIFADNLISSNENLEIINELNKIEQEKNKFFICIDELIDVMTVNKETENSNLLKSQKESFESNFNNFKNVLYSSINDEIITPTETAILIGLITTCITSLNDLKKTCNDFLFIGIGGIIYEEISKLNIEKNSIIMSLKNISTTLKSSLSLEKSSLQAQFDDVVAKLDLLDNWVNTASKDGTITVVEKSILKQRIDDLSIENGDFVEKYNEYLETLILDDDDLTTIKRQYLDYINSFNDLNNILNQVSLDNFFNESEKSKTITALEKFRANLNSFFNLLNKSLSISEENRYKQEIDGAKGEFCIQIQDVDNKINDLNDTINNTFLDNIIDEMERASIKTTMDSLAIQKNEIVSQYNRIIEKESLNNATLQIRIDLDEAYNDFIADYDSIESKVNEILNKETLVTNEDKEQMEVLYNEIISSVSLYTTNANNALIYISENEAKVVNDTFSAQITDIKNRVDNIEVGYDDTFADNIIDMAERKDIKDKQAVLEKENSDLFSQYSALMDSAYITDVAKSNLRTAYNNYNTSYNTLLSAIATVLNKETLIDDNDRTNIDNCMNDLNNYVSDFIMVANQTIQIISEEQTNQYTSEMNGKITNLENSINNIETSVEDAISDNIIDKSEKRVLKENLKNLETVKIDADDGFNKISTNPNLSTSILSKYKKAYNDYKKAYDSYVGIINGLINSTSKITTTQRNNYENTYSIYKNSLDKLLQNYQLAINNITDNISNSLKTELNKETRELKSALENLDKSMIDIFNDAYLTDEERDNITSYLNTFKDKKILITNKYNAIIEDLSDESKTALTNSYNNYITNFDSLCSAVENILARTDMLSSSDRDALDIYISNHNSALNSYSLLYRDMVDEATRNFVQNTKKDLEESLTNTNNTIVDLQNNLNGVFKDSILTEAEKTSIKQSLQQLQVEKTDIDSNYTSLYNNVDLVDTSDGVGAKTNLKNAYDEYGVSHTELVDIINNLIESTDMIDDTDRDALDTAFNSYRTKLSTYRQRVNEAIDAIANKKINDEKSERITQYNEISQKNEALTLKIGTIEEDLTNFKTTTNESLLELTDEKIISKVSTAQSNDGKELFVKTSTLEQTVSDITIKFNDINSKIENNITVISSSGVTVKMYDDDSFNENGEIIDGSTPIASTNINGQGLFIYKEEDSEPIAYFTTDGCYVANLTTDSFKNGNFIKSTINSGISKTWYVSPTETGDGSGKDSNNKSSSISGVINEIKSNYGIYFNEDEITIKIEAGTYKEIVDIEGFLGKGKILLDFNASAILYGCINVYNNTIDIELDGKRTNSSTNGAIIYSYESKSQNAINVNNSQCNINGFNAKNLSSTGTSYYGTFVNFDNGARGTISNCDILYYQYGVTSNNSSHIGFWNVRGKTQYRRRATLGGIIISGGVIPTSTESGDSINRGLIHQSGTLTETDTLGWYGGSSGGGNTDGDSSSTQTITKTFTLINLKSTTEGTGLATSGFSGKMAQGKWSNYKKHRGKATLPQSALDFLKSAKTIEKLSLSCHRLNTNHGYSTATPYPRLRFTNTSTGSSSDYYRNSDVKFARGDTKTIPISSTSINTALLNGANQLQFYIDDNNNPTQQYSHYDNVKITITITK